MELQIALLLLCITLFCFCFRHFLLPSYTAKLPPGPTGLPILGSLLQLGEKPHHTLAKFAESHGPLISLRLGSITTVVASSPQTAKLILQNHADNFLDRPVPDAIMAMPNPECTLAWIPGDHVWRNRRRVCASHMFTTQRLDSLQHLRQKKVDQLLQHITKHCVLGTPVYITDLASATILNLMSNTMFSVDLVDPRFESAQEFRELMWRIMEGVGKPNISDYFPIFRSLDLQGVKRGTVPSYKRLHEILDGIIQERMKLRASSSTTSMNDFLDVLLDRCQVDGSDFSSDTIKTLLVELIFGGSDTSSVTIEWAMAELLRNPHVMQKVRIELSEVISPGQSIKESDIDRLPYFQAVVKETMRLHPPAPLLLPYKAKNDLEICGFTIPKDSHVLVNIWAIARDPGYWEDPLSFLPERFLGSNIDFRGQDFEYLPFGAGKRICPGISLGLRMVHLVLASIIHSFSWKLPQGITPESLDMKEQFGVTLKKVVPLCAIPFIEEKCSP